MPIIRRYERQVLPRPASTSAAVPESFAGVGRAIAQAGSVLQRTADVVVNIQLERELQKDKAQVRDILNRAIARDREFMAGQYAKEGADGTGVYDDAVKYFNESRRHWIGRLATPQQQELFSQAYDPRANSHLDSALSHQSKQIEVYDRATKNAFIFQTTNDAVLMRANSDFVKNSLDEVTQTTRELYGKWGKDVLAEKILENQGAFHAAIIEADLEDDPQAAKAYFDNAVVQTQIPEKLKAVLKQKLTHAGLVRQQYERADFISAASDDPVERMKMARDSEPEIRAGVTALTKARIAEEENFKQKAEEKLLAGKINEILNVKALEPALRVADTLENGKSRLELTRLAHSLYGKDDIKTDQARMLEARIRIDRGEVPNIETLWKDYKPYADEGDWKQLETYFRSGGAAAGLKDASVRTIYKTISGTDATEEPEQYNRVWDYVRNNLPEGRKPTDEEIRKLVGQALTFGERKGGGWGYGEDMPLEEAIQKGHLETWLPDVTDDEERRIKKILKDNGKLINDKTIRLYKKHILMGLPLPAKPKEVP